MPSNHMVDLRTESGMRLDDVCFSFGVTYASARKRGFREGYGFSIELPAVLDLLDAVAKGDLKASSAREELLEVLHVLYDEAECHDFESPEDKFSWCVRDGGCSTCAARREEFTHHLATMSERWRRWTLPEHFPFAVGNSNGLHTVGCGVVRRDMPVEFPDHNPNDAEVLRAFAHPGDLYAPRSRGMERFLGNVPFQFMSAEETRAWMAENTGPKGGRYYKRCRSCAPAP
ncbi:hypothetical protein [Nocardiopsis listeri]|uniref:hypothetical protein n=1 Tax=Nocardiopsis listeri TaxID=53440 RepID=UPI000831EE28|nr:hypothetical protein [Nocardiopsis listeri]